jgi:hypothetical protein
VVGLSRFAGKKNVFILLILPLILPFVFLLLAIFRIINGTILELFIISFSITVAALIYGLHPKLVRSDKFFSKKSDENIVFEYEFIKKLLVIIIIILTILTIVYFIYLRSVGMDNTMNKDNLDYFTMESLVSLDKKSLRVFFDGYLASVAYLAIAALLRITTQRSKSEFRFYFAKSCCKIITTKNNEVEKMKYLFLLLSSYNEYLKKNLKIEINDIKKIYSIIMFKDTNQQVEIIKLICVKLQGDRLDLARYLSTLQKIPDSEFFIKESLFQQLKVIGALLAAAIPIIISITSVYLDYFKGL